MLLACIVTAGSRIGFDGFTFRDCELIVRLTLADTARIWFGNGTPLRCVGKARLRTMNRDDRSIDSTNLSERMTTAASSLSGFHPNELATETELSKRQFGGFLKMENEHEYGNIPSKRLFVPVCDLNNASRGVVMAVSPKLQRDRWRPHKGYFHGTASGWIYKIYYVQERWHPGEKY